MNSRRQMLTSALGAVALASAAQNGIAQTRRPPDDGTIPAARLSNAVLDSYGFAAGKAWTGNNTGTLKSDDFVRASLLLRLTTAHFEEVGVNAYVNAQLSQTSTGVMSPDVLHTVSQQFRAYGILLTDAEIQKTGLFSPDPNTQQQALLYMNTVGVSNFQNQLADSLDLAAKKLRLLEIATACGGLLDLLPSASRSSLQAMQANDLSRQASTGCNINQTLINGYGALTGILAAASLISFPVVVIAGLGWFAAQTVHQYTC